MRDGSVMADSDQVDFLSGSTDSAIYFSGSADLHTSIHPPLECCASGERCVTSRKNGCEGDYGKRCSVLRKYPRHHESLLCTVKICFVSRNIVVHRVKLFCIMKNRCVSSSILSCVLPLWATVHRTSRVVILRRCV